MNAVPVAARARSRVRGPRRSLFLLGPAVVAGAAYVDPGNVATNTAAGSRYGYLLVWFVVAANATAGLMQHSRPSWATSPASR